MKYVKWLVSSFITSVLFTSVAFAAPSTNAPVVKSDDLGSWTLSLSGAGSTVTKASSDTSVGGELSLGHTGKLILPIEVGVRQGIAYQSANSEKYDFSTKGFADIAVLKLGNLETDGGANFGINYGATRPNLTVAPEGVLRLYLKKDVDIFGRIEYPFDVTSGGAQNKFRYILGFRIQLK